LWYGQAEEPEAIAECGQPETEDAAVVAAALALQAAAIWGVHLAAIEAVHVEDLEEAAAADAEALSSHADASEAHVPNARTATVKTGRECFITHLQGWVRNPGLGTA
jgi:hypothetical protein